MLGIIFIIFVGIRFSKLAFDHDRNRWAFALLGIATYYVGFYLFCFLLGIIIAATGNGSFLTETNAFLLALMGIPFGIGSCVALYYGLRSYWKKNPIVSQTDLLDSTSNVKKDEF